MLLKFAVCHAVIILHIITFRTTRSILCRSLLLCDDHRSLLTCLPIFVFNPAEPHRQTASSLLLGRRVKDRSQPLTIYNLLLPQPDTSVSARLLLLVAITHYSQLVLILDACLVIKQLFPAFSTYVRDNHYFAEASITILYEARSTK